MPISDPKVSPDLRRSVGAVVIGRNEGDRLRLCLERAKSLCDTVVYADSASTDKSVEVARSLGAIVVSLGGEVPFTAARGRREGLERLLDEAPTIPFVQFVDGDCILAPDWLATAVTCLAEDEGIAAICGRRHEAAPNASFYNALIDEEWDTPAGEVEACGGDSLMRVTALKQVGSFRSDLLAGEEPELCHRLRSAGWTIRRIDAPMTEHDADIHHFREWWKRGKRGGAGYAQVWSITRRDGNPLYGRQLMSSIFWVLVLPVIALILALWTGKIWLVLGIPAAWALQVVRIAARRESGGWRYRLRAGIVVMGSKAAELIGIVQYLLNGTRGHATSYRASQGSVASPEVS